MLKVIYTETGQYLEYTSSSLNHWLARQRQLAARVGHTIYVESCTASILLPARDEIITVLIALSTHECGEPLTWTQADAHTVEVMFAGIWVSPHISNHEGTVVTDLGDRTALALFHFWVNAAQHISAMSHSES